MKKLIRKWLGIKRVGKCWDCQTPVVEDHYGLPDRCRDCHIKHEKELRIIEWAKLHKMKELEKEFDEHEKDRQASLSKFSRYAPAAQAQCSCNYCGCGCNYYGGLGSLGGLGNKP